jgi:mono/diheme cytochrome c family protein
MKLRKLIESSTVQITLSVVVLALLLARSGQSQTSFDLKASMERGKRVYDSQCITCHTEKGEGIKDVYPPLAKSDYLMENKGRSISAIVNGLQGEITVNGAKYDSEMLSNELTDEQVSDVLNYVRNSWGNQGDAVRPEEVPQQRKKKAGQ